MARVLSPALLERVIARYPLPLADAVAALVAADSVHEERDRVVEVFRGVVRWLAVLALAARGQYGVGEGGEGVEVSELLATLRRRGLTDGQWVALLRGSVQGWGGQPGRHPLPGLVRLVLGATFRGLVDALLEMRRTETVAHGGTGDDAALRALLEQRMPQLERLLDLIEGAWEGLTLAVPTGERRGRALMGSTPPRGRWRRVEVSGEGTVVLGEPLLIDGQGKPVLALAPLALWRKASADQPEELFVLDRPARRGILYISLPAMSEHVDGAAWGAVERLLSGSEGGAADEEGGRPYRGLESFGPEHASLFFGREEQATGLTGRVRRVAMVTVTGPSGSGKTSLLRAGVLPSLGEFQVVTLRPGADPCGSLARRLAGVVGEGTDAESIGAVLRRTPEAVGPALVRWSEARGRRLLIVVDQAEEVFTQSQDPRGRGQFARALAACGSDDAGPLRVVLVVREDFFARLATLEALQGVYSRAVEVVTTPDRAALARAVAMPALRFGYTFDPGLVDRMVAAAADEPSALALLQFCADRLWEARDRRWKRITAEAYEALGGVEGALAAHAERTLRDLTPSQQGAARMMLLRLVTAEGTRALCTPAELLAATGAIHDGHLVLERLIEARLVVAREETGGRQASFELVHEALLRHWERLRLWQEQNRDEQRRLDSLRRAAREWEVRGRPRGLLWRDEVLAEHKLWRRHTTTRLTEDEEDFLEASSDEESRAARWRRGAMSAGLGGLLLSLVVMAVQRAEAVQSREEAERAQRRAEASREEAERALRQSEVGRLSAEAGRRESLGRPAEAAALLRAAASLAVPAADSLVADLARLASLGDAPRVLRGGQGPVRALALSRDGQTLLVASGDHARAFFGPDWQPLDLPHEATVWAALVSPDGRLALTASADRSAALWRLPDGARVATLLHPAEVQAAAFSPDGHLAATGASDGKIRIFHTDDGQLIRQLDHHHHSLTALAFSPDGRRLAAGSRDRTASLWSVEDGALVRPFGPFDDPVGRVAFSPEGATLALVHKRTVELVATEGLRARTLSGHEHLIHDLAFSHDGTRLVTASSDRTARLWDARSGAPDRVLAVSDRPLLRAAFSPDGLRVVTASADGLVRVHDAAAGTLLRSLRGPPGGVSDLAFSPDGQRLVASSRDDDATFLWTLDDGAPSVPLRGHGDDLYAIAFSPDGTRLATASRDRTARLWDTGSGAPLARLEHREPAYAVAFSPDGTRLATASYERTVRLWDTASGKLLHALPEPEGYVPALAFSPDGRHLATASVDRKVRLYEASSARLLRTFEAREGAPFGLAFSSDGHHLASIADDGAVRFFDDRASDTAEPSATLPAAAGYAEAITAAPGLLAAGASDGSATVWDADHGTVRASMRGHQGSVLAVALSRDARLLASGSSDQTAAVFRLDTGARVLSLAGHAGPVLAVAFSPDASLLATGSSDRTIRLWTIPAGKLLAVLGGHDDRVRSLAFSPDGRLLASASHDDTARLWTLAPLRAAPAPFTSLGARTNLRVCRTTNHVVAVLPLPAPESVWAPDELCAPAALPAP